MRHVRCDERPRSPSPSSSDSDLDDDHGALEPVGDQISHDVLIRRPIYIERVGFTYALRTPDGTEHTYEDIAVEQIRASGLNPNQLVIRHEFLSKSDGRWRLKFRCADWRMCWCPYYLYVNFGRRHEGTIEERVDNIHDNHIPIARDGKVRVRATQQQKLCMDACLRDGLKPTAILRRLRDEGLDAGLKLQYVQRYKNNHKTSVLGQGGFMGTVQEYEDLFNACAVEDNTLDDIAGVVYWEIKTPVNQQVQVRVIISSKRRCRLVRR